MSSDRLLMFGNLRIRVSEISAYRLDEDGSLVMWVKGVSTTFIIKGTAASQGFEAINKECGLTPDV